MSTITNQDFGERVGLTHTGASRLRSGDRLPSTRVIHRIHQEYLIPLSTLMEAYDQGAEAFGQLLRERVFNVG